LGKGISRGVVERGDGSKRKQAEGGEGMTDDMCVGFLVYADERCADGRESAVRVGIQNTKTR